jgi:WD40 repeat protein
MSSATILLLSLIFASSSVSSIQLVSYSCDQTWLAQVPNAQEASFAFSGDGAHMAIGEFEQGSLLFGPSYPNGTNNLIYITPQPVPQILFAPISPAPFGPWRIWMSATGYVIAAALKEGGVQLFSQATPEFEWKFPGTEEFNTLGVSGDGRFVPALVGNGTLNALYLLSAEYDNITWSYHFAPSAGNFTSSQPVGISYDGARIATLVGRSIFVFSASSNQTLWSKVLDSPQVVFMSQDGNYLAIIENSDITVYSATTGALERTITLDRTWTPGGITLPDQAFSFSNDGSTIAIIDGSILKVWDRASGTELFTKSGIDQIQVGSSTVSERPDSVSMSQNGTIIVVGSEQRAVFVFDRSGNQLCKSYDGPSDHGAFTLVKISDDGKHVAAFAQDTAALFTITPQYAFLILAGSAIAAATIILGYLGRKRLGKIRGRVHW